MQSNTSRVGIYKLLIIFRITS